VRTASDDLFKALGHPTRRAIFEQLSHERELTAKALVRHLGVSQPAISKHLGALKLAGLVRERRAGRQIHYSAEPRALIPLIDWMTLFGAFWRDRFDRLEDFVKGRER